MLLLLGDLLAGAVLLQLLSTGHSRFIVVLLVHLLLSFLPHHVFGLMLLLLRLLTWELLLLLKYVLCLLHLLLLQQVLVDELPRQLLGTVDHHVAVVFNGRGREDLHILLEVLQRLARLGDHVSVH